MIYLIYLSDLDHDLSDLSVRRDLDRDLSDLSVRRVQGINSVHVLARLLRHKG